MLDIDGPLIDGTLLSRPNRFLALVSLDGRQVPAHVPNSGRLNELMTHGKRVLLRPAARPDRRTAYDLVMVEHAGGLVSVDTRIPTRLVEAALPMGLIPELDGYDRVQPEFVYRDSRLDFRLSKAGEECLVEVKSVTLVERGRALFPDAPTQRGTKHLLELLHARRAGHRAVIFFVVQRQDGVRFAPNELTDPLFAVTLREVVSQGVEILAYRCEVQRDKIRFASRIPVHL